jgi:quinol monooxygenase YgiN
MLNYQYRYPLAILNTALSSSSGPRKTMSKIQVSARMKIRDDMLEGFKRQANECIEQVKEKDSGTLQYDWFLNEDKNVCEIRETYKNSEALLSHVTNLRESLHMLFEKYATDHSVTIYGEPSAELLENTKARGIDITIFSFLEGL